MIAAHLGQTIGAATSLASCWRVASWKRKCTFPPARSVSSSQARRRCCTTRLFPTKSLASIRRACASGDHVGAAREAGHLGGSDATRGPGGASVLGAALARPADRLSLWNGHAATLRHVDRFQMAERVIVLHNGQVAQDAIKPAPEDQQAA